MPSDEQSPNGKKSDPYVLVGHSGEDSERIGPIIEAMREKGFRVRLDRVLDEKDEWSDAIASKVANCSVLVAFISKKSLPFAQKELEYALDRGVQVVPVHLDGAGLLPEGLARRLGASHGVTDVSDLDHIIAQLVEALELNEAPKEKEDQGLLAPFLPSHLDLQPEKSLKAVAPLVLPILAAISLIGLIVMAVTQKPSPPQPAPDAELFITAPPAKPSAEAEPMAAAPAGQAAPAPEAAAASAAAPEAAVAAPAPEAAAPAAPEPEATTPSAPAPEAAAPEASASAAPAATSPEATAAAPEAATQEEAAPAPATPPIPPSVTSESWGAFSMAAEKTALSPSERFEVKVAGVDPAMIANGAMVGLYRQEAGVEDFLYYVQIDHGEEVLRLDAPRAPGLYELRAFTSNRSITPDAQVAVISLTVE